MARRANVSKLIQEIHLLAELANRRAPGKPVSELWTPARPKVLMMPAPRRTVMVESPHMEISARPVKITHRQRPNS